MTDRARLEDIAIDTAGNVQSGWSVYVFQRGTAAATVPPTGTTVNVYSARTSGSTLQTAGGSVAAVDTTDANGGWEVFTDYAETFDIVYTKGSTAVLDSADAVQLTNDEAFYKIMWVDPSVPSTNDTLPATIRGHQRTPYCTLLQAITDIPASGNNRQGTYIRIRGGTNATAPTNGTHTITSKLVIPGFTTIEGTGGDADVSKSSSIIKANFSGVAVETGGRSIKLRNLAITNIHASGVGLGIGTTSVSGGFQSFNADHVHIYGCGSDGIQMATFNCDSTKLHEVHSQNNTGYGLKMHGIASGESPNMFVADTCDFSSNTAGAVYMEMDQTGEFSSGNTAVFDKCKAHGAATRFDIRGWHNVTIRNGYYEVSGDISGPVIKIRKGSAGATATYYAYNINIYENDFHGPTIGGTYPANTGIVLDADECRFVTFEKNMVRSTNAAAGNEVVRLGTNCTRSYFHLGHVMNNNDHNNEMTAVANLVSNSGGMSNRIVYWDGTKFRQLGDDPGTMWGTTTWNPPNLVAVGDVTTTTVTVTGARAGDTVAVGFETISTNQVVLCGWVSGDDTVTVLLENKQGANLNLANGTVTCMVWRPRA